MQRTFPLLFVAAVLIAAALLPYLFSQQPSQTPRAAGLGEDTAAVRIEFGVRDTTPASWDGSAEARSGEIVSIRNWRPRPGDSVASNRWSLKSRQGANFILRPWETERLTDPERYILTPGVIVDVKGTAAAEVAIETTHGSFTLKPFELGAGKPVAFLNGNVTAERVAAAEKLSDDVSDADFPAIASLGQGRVAVAWVHFANNRNELMWRSYDGRQWSPARAIPTNHNDIFLVKLARDRADRLWAVWSAQVKGNWDLYASRWSGSAWSQPEQLTSDPQPDIYHVTATDSNGNLWVAWMGFRNGKSDVFARRYTGAQWTEAERVSTSQANDWAPAIAADGRGRVYIGWDSYDKGNYDVMLRHWEGGKWSEPRAVANSLKLEYHVSLACDRENRLWAAWNEAGMDWGKDTGFLPRKQGTPLYRDRWMGVAVHDGQRWMEPLYSINDVLPEKLKSHNDMPSLAADANGRVWLFFRHRLLRIRDTPFDTPAHRAAWEIFMTTYEGDSWSTPTPVPFSQGRQDMRVGFASSGNALLMAWPTDNRDFEEFLYARADVYVARLPLPAGPPQPARLTPRVQPELKLFPTHYEEAKDLARIHGYTIESGGKRYKIYRGDTHRHTEFSMDGNNDGSLLDAYRYAIDAAELDFLLVSEHNGNGGPDNAYPNWLLQQMADLFTLTGKFVPFYGYERSVNYPNGHRNILFARRGNPTLPISPEEQKAVTGAKMLYEYLKKYNGIAISHTSASNMGTDWRDNDPDVEPLVEIYQGDRVSAEYEGAPKAAHAGNPASAPGGFRPAGYVWNAWAKGYKLGVQVASDHFSTHISYACTLTTDYTRQGMLDAMKLRHSYGATDNIILDYRMQSGGKEYLQGDIVNLSGDFALSVKVIGTAPIRQIDIIRNNQFLLTRHPLEREAAFEFRDAKPLPGESYYYVRLIQVDDQMAWSSPIWIKRP